MNLNKTLMFPHVWQIAGWWMLAVSVILTIALIAANVGGVLHNVHIYLLWIPVYVGALLVCLSREKVDDEYISTIRGRIVCILVCVAVVAKVFYMVVFFSSIYRFFPIMGYMGMFSYLYNPLVMMTIYIISLKLTLFIQNRRIRYAEQ